jgi:hypothetical protein
MAHVPDVITPYPWPRGLLASVHVFEKITTVLGT